MSSTDLYTSDGETPRAEAAGTAPSALELLKALRRRWLLATTLGVLGCVTAGLLAWFVLPPPPHTARAQLYVASDQPRVLFTTNESRSDAGAFRQTQIALLKSRLVLNAALRQAKIGELPLVRHQEDPVAWLEKELKATSGASPELLSVALNGDQPQQLKLLVDAVIGAYMQEIVNKEQIKRQARLDHLKTIAGQYDEQLRRKRRTMRELVENVGSSDKQAIAMKQLFAVEQYHLTEKELLQVRSELRKLHTEAAGQGPDGFAFEPAPEALNASLEKDPVIARYQAARVRLEEELSEARRKLVKSDNHPAVQRYVKDIATTDRLLDKRREELRPRIEAQLRERARLDYAAQGALVQKRIEYCQRLEKQLSEDVKRLEDEAKLLNKTSFDAEALKTEIAQAEDVSRKVTEEAEKLTVELQAEPRVRLLEEAIIDSGDSRARQIRNALAAGLGVLGVILLAVSWWEQRTHRIETVEQVTQALGMKLVGTLPVAPVGKAATEGPKELWPNAFHESVVAARTMLLHVARSDSLQVVMVTSAVAGEGKTSLSSQLSASLARAGHKVLLIDGDLRKPDAHRLFGSAGSAGLSELLRGEVAASQAIQRSTLSNLWFLGAGKCDGRALQALAQGRVKEALDELKELFEFIIVDSSPVLPVADAVQLGQQVDGVLFSVLRNVSRLPRIRAAEQRLSQLGIRVLGAVFLGARADANDYGYEYVAQEQA
jgi:capsular exopolysaccharide synthesis family protein